MQRVLEVVLVVTHEVARVIVEVQCELLRLLSCTMYRVRRVCLLLLCAHRCHIELVCDEGLLTDQFTRDESSKLPEVGVNRLLSEQSIMKH